MCKTLNSPLSGECSVLSLCILSAQKNAKNINLNKLSMKNIAKLCLMALAALMVAMPSYAQ